jgi:hypothetical protein
VKKSAINRKKPPAVRLIKSNGQLQVWLCDKGIPRTMTGAVNARLASDARRYGQDLVEELVDRTLRQADVRETAHS